MTTKKTLTPAQQKERRQIARGIVEQLAGSTIINEVLDKSDGVYTKQLVRIGLEITDELMRETA